MFSGFHYPNPFFNTPLFFVETCNLKVLLGVLEI